MNSRNSHLIKLLEIIPGDNIEFENNIPIKHNAKNANFSPEEEAEIEVIPTDMLNKRIIRETIHASTEFVSPISIVKKPDGESRLIRNLKNLNEFVKQEHIKIDGIKTIINMVTKDRFMEKQI